MVLSACGDRRVAFSTSSQPGSETNQDVVIAGGGVIGSSIAYFLASSPSRPARITVVEKDHTYRFSSTTLSASSIRHQFSTPENIQMSMFGTHFLRNINDYLGYDDQRFDPHFKEGGYLFLASTRKDAEGTMAGLAVLEANHKVQRRLGVDVVLLDPPQIKQRFPWINVEGISKASLGLSGEGWFDPATVLMAFKQKAQYLGVTFLKDEVVGVELDQQKRKVNAVKLKSGTSIPCGYMVNAAGPQALAVSRMIGEEGLPVRPRKRCVFVFQCKEKFASPLVIDPSGVYWRPEGSGFICGISPPVCIHTLPNCLHTMGSLRNAIAKNDPDVAADDFEVDHHLFEDDIWPALAERVPAFEAIKMTNAWAGHYEYNTFDHNAIVGPHPRVKNFYYANGFSGHGLQQGPAAGRAVSELITEGKFKSIDLSAFSFERIQQNKPIVELNVI